MSAYTVRAVRWDGGWELHIEGIGVTQTTSLSTADRMVRSYLAMDGYADALTADLDFVYDVGPAGREIARSRSKTAAAERAVREAADSNRSVARKLLAAGLSGREVASVLGVSPQRVSQLVSVRSARAAAKRAAGRKSASKG